MSKFSDEIPLYRFIDIKHFYRILEQRTFWFTRVDMWEDPYENFLSRVSYKLDDVSVTYADFEDLFYAQSWTLCPETDAMWRIYSHNKNAVRIKSTVGKLKSALVESLSQFTILPITYFTKSELKEWVNAHEFITMKVFKDSLYLKRVEFSHEKEVRIVFCLIKSEENIINPIRIPILVNPTAIIEEITFDPRIRNQSFQRERRKIERIGFGIPINKSTLYDDVDFKRPFFIKN